MPKEAPVISSTRTRTQETRMVTTPLGDLAVRVAGFGPAKVVLWPSIFTDGHIYDGLVSRLAAEATSLSPQLCAVAPKCQRNGVLSPMANS